MKSETRAIVYDGELRVEAYRFEGIAQPFPNHFHEHYTIGLVEKGERCLSCRNRTYALLPGHILLLNPGDNHACTQSDGGTLDYRGLNIPREVMRELAGEITGRREVPGFCESVLKDDEAACCLRRLHESIMKGSREFDREENLLLLLSLLMQRCGQPIERRVPECREEIERACAFMEEHCAESIRLDEICRRAGLGKSALLRAFAREKGITPYGYLVNIRVGKAKRLLEQGAAPVEAALQTGFSDQSHFTHTFSRMIGLTPGVYREIFARKEEQFGYTE